MIDSYNGNNVAITSSFICTFFSVYMFVFYLFNHNVDLN